MGRRDLIDRFTDQTDYKCYQVVLCDVRARLSRKIYECETLEDALKLVEQRRQDSLSRKPRRNKYMIWFRKSVWNAVVLESGFLRK